MTSTETLTERLAEYARRDAERAAARKAYLAERRAETKGHSIKWFVFSCGERLPRTSTMRGGWDGYDAECSCGWGSPNRGGNLASVRRTVDDHKAEVRYDRSVEAVTVAPLDSVVERGFRPGQYRVVDRAGILLGYVEKRSMERLSGRPSVTGATVYETRWAVDIAGDECLFDTRAAAVTALVEAAEVEA